MSLQRKTVRLDLNGLWEYALKVLGGRALSAAEVRTKLRAKAAEAGDVDPVMRKLKEYGFLDDARLAGTYAAARRDNQGFGQFRVMQDLRKRRIAPPVAEKAAAEAFSEVDEVEQASRFLERKYRGKDLPAFLGIEKNTASAYRRLRMAGFGTGAVIQVLKRYSVRADELEDTDGADEG